MSFIVIVIVIVIAISDKVLIDGWVRVAVYREFTDQTGNVSRNLTHWRLVEFNDILNEQFSN